MTTRRALGGLAAGLTAGSFLDAGAAAAEPSRSGPAAAGRKTSSYTFQELFTLAPAYDPSTHHLAADATLTITQQDGRCGYGFGQVYVNPLTRTVSVSPTHQPPSIYRVYRLSFHEGHDVYPSRDEIGLILTDGERGGCDLTVILWQWGGGRYGVHLALPRSPAAHGNLYTGWGDTIGHGQGRALHTLSFTHLRTGTILG